MSKCNVSSAAAWTNRFVLARQDMPPPRSAALPDYKKRSCTSVPLHAPNTEPDNPPLYPYSPMRESGPPGLVVRSGSIKKERRAKWEVRDSSVVKFQKGQTGL